MPWFEGSRGGIHHDTWLPEGDVRSVVVFLHGFGEHLGLYDAFARRLTADGQAVHALDCAGHGRSDGERGLITWDAYAEDALTLVGIAARRHPGVPLVLAGHSAGALAAYLVALRRPEVCDALVLSGGPLRPLDWVTGTSTEADEEAGELDPTSMLSTHPDYVHALLHDPLCYGGEFPPAMLESLVQTWPEVEDGLAALRPEHPILLVHGEIDPVVPVAVAQEVAAGLQNATLRVFPGDLHDVLNEHDRDDVHEVVAEFVGRVTAPEPVAS